MAVGFPTKANWAAGDVLTASAQDDLAGTVNLLSPVGQANGANLVASSSTSSGLGWSGNQAAGRNALINGGFDVWQRGTSFSTAGNYTADRWYGNWTGTATYSQETTTVPSGCKFAMRMTANTTSSMYLTQNIETLNAVQFAGQNVTFSFQAQGSVSTGILMVVQYSTTTDNATTNSWTTLTATTGGSGTAPVGSFATISGTYAIPSTAKSILVNFNTTSTAAAAYIIVGKAQFELGSVITNFVRNAATYQGELAACMRYYQTNGDYNFFGAWYSTGSARFYYTLPVTMRTAPTPTFPTGPYTNNVDVVGVGSATPTAVANNVTNTKAFSFDATGATGAVVSVAAVWRGSAIQLSAEL